MMTFLKVSLFLILSTQLLLAGLNVRDLGAKGDGKTVDTLAIQRAINLAAACGGQVDFPPGKYLTGSLDLKTGVTLSLDKDAVIQGSSEPDDYPLVTARWEGKEKPCHRALISARDASNIAIIGSGSVQGTWSVGRLRNPRGPTVIEPISCKNVRIQGITVKNSDMWTIHPTYCQDVTISGVTFHTNDFDSDGIDADSCQRVTIDGCNFTTGDDSIAIKSGKGAEGVKAARPSEDITITNCTFIKGYSSIALGSELSGGIRRVKISNCTFEHGRAAIYMKSQPGRGGFIEDVEADHLIVGKEPLLEVQTNYGYNSDSGGVPGLDGLTSFSNISIGDVTMKSNKTVKVEGSAAKPLDGLELKNISGTAEKGFTVKNAVNVQVQNVQLTGLKGRLLTTTNVQTVTN